jgi:alpha-ketoglutarate-dependent taurine dioxygenase
MGPLGVVEAEQTSAPEAGERDLAREILQAWESSLVVHVKGIGARPDLLEFWDRMTQRIGRPVELGEDATVGDRDHQRTGQRWMEVRFDPTIQNAYRHSRSAQPLHTDGSYIPGFPSTLMFCVSSAPSGGETTFLPGTDLVQILDARRPDLLQSLWSVPVPHRRSGDERTECILRRNKQGDVLVNWNYFCIDRAASREATDLAEEFFAFLRDEPAVNAASLPVLLRPGEAVIWKDDRVLHGRNAFQAMEASQRWIWKCALDVGVPVMA